jgi:chromosome segregation ATPase
LQRDIKNLQRRNAKESGDSEQVAKLTELNDILTAERDDYQLQLQEQLETNQQLLGDALKLAQVQTELDDASQALHSTRQEIESLRQRANELQSKLDATQSSAVDESSVLALQDRISELEQSITDHQDNAQLADTEAADMRMQIQALKASEQAAKVKILELESTIAKLEAVRAEALQESSILQQKHAEFMKATESKNESAIQLLNTEIAALKQASSSAEQDKAALINQHTQLIDSLKLQHSSVIADLQQKLDSSINSLHMGSDLEQSLQTRITALEQEQQQSLTSAKAATDELQALRQQLELVQQESCDTASKFKDALAQLEVAQLAHSSLVSKHEACIESHSQSVQQMKDEHLKVVQELQAKLDSNQIMAKEEQSTESVLKQRISELESNLADRNKQFERIESEISDLQHQLNQLKSADAVKSQTIDELRASISESEISHSSLLQQKEETIAQLKAEHLAKLAAIETASASNTDHSVEVEQLTLRISELTSSIEQMQQSAVQLQTNAEESTLKILALESAQSTKEQLISALRQQVADIQKLKQESVEKLEEEIESLKSIHSNSLAEIRAELASERFKVESAAARELELLQQIENLQNAMPRADGSTSSNQLVVSNPSQCGHLTTQIVNLRSELESVRTQYGKMASYISQVMSLASPALLRKVQISQFESRNLLAQTEQAYRSELTKRRQLALQVFVDSSFIFV